MKRPSQLLAWLILKPLSIVCLIGGLIAFFVIEAGTLSEEGDPRMAERVRAVLTPWLVATAILTRELDRNEVNTPCGVTSVCEVLFMFC